MITAIVMIDAATDAIPEVAAAIADLDGVSEVYSTAGEVDLIAIVRVREFEQIAEITGVSEVYSVTGDTDLVAMVRVTEHERLADVIADRISKVDGVIGTRTYIAFRTYSEHDLDAAFNLGLDG